MATAAGGAHSIGMHSCSYLALVKNTSVKVGYIT